MFIFFLEEWENLVLNYWDYYIWKFFIVSCCNLKIIVCCEYFWFKLWYRKNMGNEIEVIFCVLWWKN